MEKTNRHNININLKTSSEMGVSKNRGTPKWMVKIMENPIFLMDDLGENPTIFGNIHI